MKPRDVVTRCPELGNTHPEKITNEGRYAGQRRFTLDLELHRFRSRMLSFMRDFDVLLCPVMNGPADKSDIGDTLNDVPLKDRFDLLVRQGGYSYCMAFNLTGWPAATVPAATSPDGMPIGVQVAAKPWREDIVLKVASELEKTLGGWRPPRNL